MQLRGGTAQFQVETGRWQGVAREDQVCQECDDCVIEGVAPLDVELPCLQISVNPLLHVLVN